MPAATPEEWLLALTKKNGYQLSVEIICLSNETEEAHKPLSLTNSQNAPKPSNPRVLDAAAINIDHSHVLRQRMPSDPPRELWGAPSQVSLFRVNFSMNKILISIIDWIFYLVLVIQFIF